MRFHSAAAAAAGKRVLATILLILHITSTSTSSSSSSSWLPGEVILKEIEKVDIKKGLDEAKRLLKHKLQGMSSEQALLDILVPSSAQDRDELLESLRSFHDRLSSLGESLEAVESRVEATVEKLRGKVAHFEELKRVDGPDGASVVMSHICGDISSPLGSKMDKETQQSVAFGLRDFQAHYFAMHLFPSFGSSMKKSEGEEVECLSFGEEEVVRYNVLNYLKERLRFDAILHDKQSKEVKEGAGGGLSEEDRRLIHAMIVETVIVVLLIVILSVFLIFLLRK
ncbi:MAG: hypothetical protein MHMPM18_004399 [Marteilia pararefringens]